MDAAIWAAKLKEAHIETRIWMLRNQAEYLRMQADLDAQKASIAAGYRSNPLSRKSPSKCSACGSHEFRQHNNVRICSYCRCGQ